MCPCGLRCNALQPTDQSLPLLLAPRWPHSLRLGSLTPLACSPSSAPSCPPSLHVTNSLVLRLCQVPVRRHLPHRQWRVARLHAG